MGVLQYGVSCVSGAVVIVLFTIGFIIKPNIFRAKTRKTPPKCLADPSWKHGYLHLTDIKIHYVERGDRSKPLMLFVHGFPEFWYSWRYQLKEFSKDHWAVAIDMRGYGDSDKPAGVEKYSMDLLVNDLKLVIEALGRQKCTLVAHDWGGLVAWSFVRKHSDMLERYIILNAPYTPTFMLTVMSNLRQFIKSWYLFFFQLPYLPELALAADDFAVFTKIFRRNKPKTLSCVSDEDINAFKYVYGKPGALTPPFNYYRDFVRKSRSATNTDVKLDTRVPGLLLFGELDDALILDNVTITQKHVKNLQVRTLRGANHFVQQDDPSGTNQQIREFLRHCAISANPLTRVSLNSDTTDTDTPSTTS